MRLRLHELKKSANGRSGLLAVNVVASFMLKGWSALIVFLMMPLTIHCLGEYKNGVWLTISSLVLWIDQMDIGLGNGLRNKLASCMAHNDIEKARSVVSSTVAMLVMIMLPILVLLSALVWLTDVYAFLNVDPEIIPELRVSLLCAVVLVCMTFVLKFIGNVYMGMQLPAVSNLINTIGSTVALLSTWLFYIYGHATFFNVVIVNIGAPLLTYLLAYPYTFYVRYKMLRPGLKWVNMGAALELGNIGVRFFWLQVAAIVQFMSANILISNFFTPAMVTPYQIAYRYMNIVVIMFNVVSMPFWNATTDAYERGDMEWIRKASRSMNYMTLAVAAALVVMVLVSPWAYQFWIGKDCDVPFGITVMMAIYIFLLIVSMRYSCFLNGVGALRMQLYMTVMAVVFIPLAWFVSSYTHDIVWFMAVMCFCNVPGIVVNAIQFNKILKGKANGIWRIENTNTSC